MNHRVKNPLFIHQTNRFYGGRVKPSHQKSARTPQNLVKFGKTGFLRLNPFKKGLRGGIKRTG